MRKIIVLFMLFILMSISGCNHKAQWNHFTWVEYSFGDQYYEKAAILIPLKLSGSDEEYYVQLDTGAPSFLNENSFSDIIETIVVKEHTSSAVTLDGMLANYEFENKKFNIKHNYGLTLEELQKAEYKKLGNLGMDFFEDGYLIIDFPRTRFMVANSKRQIYF